MSPYKQCYFLIRHSLKIELKDQERYFAPLLLALTIILMFAFTLGDLDPSVSQRVFLGQVTVTSLFTLQISLGRSFEPEKNDKVFETMRTSPISFPAWFISKLTIVYFNGCILLIPIILLSAAASSLQIPLAFSKILGLLGLYLFSLIGLSSLGVLLSTMTLSSESRLILFPVLFFPLTTPLLLSSIETASIYLGKGTLTDDAIKWLTLMAGVNVIYLVIGFLLFQFLLDPAD